MITFITLKEPKIKNFAASRNELLKKAKTDWVFFTDSDETVSKELKKEIGKLDLNKFNGFYIKRKNYFLGQFIGIDNIVRMGKKGKGLWERGVHELWKINGPIGQLKNPLIHNTAKNLREYINKINFYSSLHAVENQKEGKRSSLIKIILYPSGKFVFELIKSRNVVFSIMQSFHSFLSWTKMYLRPEQK